MTDTNSSLTRRELLAASAGLAAATALPTADAQVAPVPNMPTSSRELWQWVRTQPMLDTQVAYLDVASGGPTLRAAMASEYRAREAQSLGLANAADTLDRRNQAPGGALRCVPRLRRRRSAVHARCG